MGEGRQLRFTTISLLLLLTVLPSAADLRIERTGLAFDPEDEVGTRREWADVLFVGAGGVRRDLPSFSTIIRAGEDTYVHIDHRAKAYAEVPVPLKLEDLLTERDLKCLRWQPLALADLTAEVTLTGESRLIGRWQTKRLRVLGRHPIGLEIEEDIWITHDLPVDLALYFKMMHNKAALSPISRGWYADFTAAGGFPVESTMIRRMHGNVRRRTEQRLDSVTEVEPDPARYRPPAGYSPTLQRPPLDVACPQPPPLPGRPQPGRATTGAGGRRDRSQNPAPGSTTGRGAGARDHVLADCKTEEDPE